MRDWFQHLRSRRTSESWPDISAICQLLAAQNSKRFVAIHDDTIIGAPDSARPSLVEFLRMRQLKVSRQSGQILEGMRIIPESDYLHEA
jgi:hypothetical protein